MAGGKKDDNAAGFVLILVCVILWGIYVAVRALINLNERFIDAVSNPAGIIGLFLVCLLYLQFYFVFLFTGDSERKQQPLSRPFQSWFRESGVLMKLSMPR